MDFVFVTLLRDNNLAKTDQDYEFPVCFIVEAANKDGALNWGEQLTMEFCLNNENIELINTMVESPNNYSNTALENLPRVPYGYNATEEEIGW